MANKLVGFVLLCCAAYLLYLPSELGASLTIPPDSSEYAISLTNLFNHGKFGFTLNGTWYPSRYAPWFSLTCLWPAYWASSGNSLCYHWAVLLFALGTLILVTRWARFAGLSSWRAYMPAVLLMLLPDFVFYSRLVMTEIPYACLFAASALLFVRMALAERISLWHCLGAGLLVTWCGMVRASALPLLALFGIVILVKRIPLSRKAIAMVPLAVPAAFYEGMNLFYNWRTFGSPFRSGYNFWVPIPCDFPNLLFNFSYVRQALLKLPTEPVMLITAALFALSLLFALLIVRGHFGGIRANRPFLLLLAYLCSHAVVLFVLYLGYYWYDTRFYLSLTICAVPLAAVALDRLVHVRCFHAPGIVLFVVYVLAAICFLQAPTRYSFMTNGRPIWLQEALATARILPENSVVMQLGDPNIMDHFGFATKGIRLLPGQRCFDYVTYITAPKSIRGAGPLPKSWAEQEKAMPALVASGDCKWPFPSTFSERPAVVREYLANGRRVFVHKGRSTCPEWMDYIAQAAAKMGLKMIPYQTCLIPALQADPIRHVYDQWVFPSFVMDARPEITSEYFELVCE